MIMEQANKVKLDRDVFLSFLKYVDFLKLSSVKVNNSKLTVSESFGEVFIRLKTDENHSFDIASEKQIKLLEYFTSNSSEIFYSKITQNFSDSYVFNFYKNDKMIASVITPEVSDPGGNVELYSIDESDGVTFTLNVDDLVKVMKLFEDVSEILIDRLDNNFFIKIKGEGNTLETDIPLEIVGGYNTNISFPKHILSNIKLKPKMKTEITIFDDLVIFKQEDNFLESKIYISSYDDSHIESELII